MIFFRSKISFAGRLASSEKYRLERFDPVKWNLYKDIKTLKTNSQRKSYNELIVEGEKVSIQDWCHKLKQISA